MKIGFIGLGKLGLPCALAIDSKGHDVFGYDINPEVENYLLGKEIPYKEEGAPELLKNHKIRWGSIEYVVENSDVIFVPIQTPHHPKYEGVDRLLGERVDFDYTFLKYGMKSLSDEVEKQGRDKVVIII